MKKVVVITGPTAVGKTKISLGVAKHFSTDLINADAYQIYKKMDIGTAKPTVLERENIVHHFMDFLDPSSEYSISEYQKEVRNLIDKMHHEDKLPILVGGSGLYIDTVIRDYRFEEERRNDELENKYRDFTNDELHNILKKMDYEVSKKIHPNNRKRVLRAIELCNSSSSKNSRSQAKDFYYETLCIFLSDERNELYERINKRVDLMIENGLVDEIREIGIDNFSKTSKVAIGYKEIIDYLEGNNSLEEAIENIKKNSRHYAKRQFTWFKNKTDSIIVNVDVNDLSVTLNKVIFEIEKFLNKS